MEISDTIKAFVWRKARSITGYNPAFVRKDSCGATIEFNKYGNRDSRYGWEIDHVIPASQGGTDHLSNLRPLQWYNNASRQDGPLVCKVTA